MSREKIFKSFFGLKPSAIKSTVVISPIIYPNRFGKVKYRKTILGYLTANLRQFTFIKTPMTQAAVADAVILLKKTPCRKIVFVGAIGGLAKCLRIGDVVRTNKAKDIYSVNSIHEEIQKRMLSLRRKGVVGIDFESRAFFAAARKAKLAAQAYYVVTDLPLSKPFYAQKTKEEEARIKAGLAEIISLCQRPSRASKK